MDRVEQLVTLSGVAADQWGLVTAAQAKALGLSAVQLMRLAEAGLLESVGRGVYALQAAGLPQHLEVKVAWLRLQPRVPAWERPLGGRDSGVVSHASACRLHGLGDIPAPDVEISVPRRRTTTEPFVRLRTASLEPADITVVDGLPVTTAARTIVDLLRAKADGGHVGGVIADAERRDLVDLDALAEAVQPHARKYGLSLTATGHQLIEHLVAQAGRTLHSQEIARAGQEGFTVGAGLFGALDRDTAALAPFLNGEALAAEALAPVFRNIAAQQIGIRAALNGAMPSSGLTQSLQQAILPGEGLLSAVKALKLPSVLSPETRRALQRAAVPGTAMARAVQVMQQLEAVSPSSTSESAGDDGPAPDGGQPNELKDKHAPS
ncbi:hypothetical protein GCM10027073_62940 [Streptomyces chlorus]|uniref:Type IV toxin-antitoxin system AbiEi family antitoxin domain-containing protein n=1 Tax=Streptomyces chlorus TaxID=887452 RepID=A0ABW1DUA8_9ACTN